MKHFMEDPTYSKMEKPKKEMLKDPDKEQQNV